MGVPVRRQRRLPLEVLCTVTKDEEAIASSMLIMVSSTWYASSPEARCGRPARMALAISSTPVPRADCSAGPISTLGSSW